MNLEQYRKIALQHCAEAGITVVPYGNAWWLLGEDINHVVGELAGLSLPDIPRHRPIPR